MRYQTLEQPPQVNFLYSPSGERRYFFDVRNTRYGNRLHIAQVTDLHRNVIGVPLESMVAFRDRLTQIIDSLHLEDGKDLRDALEKRSNRPVRRRPMAFRTTSMSQSNAAAANANRAPAAPADNAAPKGKPKAGPGPQGGGRRRRNTASTSQKRDAAKPNAAPKNEANEGSSQEQQEQPQQQQAAPGAGPQKKKNNKRNKRKPAPKAADVKGDGEEPKEDAKPVADATAATEETAVVDKNSNNEE